MSRGSKLGLWIVLGLVVLGGVSVGGYMLFFPKTAFLGVRVGMTCDEFVDVQYPANRAFVDLWKQLGEKVSNLDAAGNEFVTKAAMKEACEEAGRDGKRFLVATPEGTVIWVRVRVTDKRVASFEVGLQYWFSSLVVAATSGRSPTYYGVVQGKFVEDTKPYAKLKDEVTRLRSPILAALGSPLIRVQCNRYDEAKATTDLWRRGPHIVTTWCDDYSVVRVVPARQAVEGLLENSPDRDKVMAALRKDGLDL
jgi:hypothetical protein